MVVIRDYTETDAEALWCLFYNTVMQVNAQDYTQSQLNAWAPRSFDPSVWADMLSNTAPFVAVLDNIVVGYADLQSDGLIDHFFCHHKYQGQGIGRALMLEIVMNAKTKGIQQLYAHVSKTAVPFFTQHGFILEKAQEVRVRGEVLTNYMMTRNI